MLVEGKSVHKTINYILSVVSIVCVCAELKTIDFEHRDYYILLLLFYINVL